MSDTIDETDWAEEAQDLMEAGEWQQALEVLDDAPDDDGVRWLLSTSVWIEVNQLELASDDLAKAGELLGDDDPDVVRIRGRLATASWDFVGARAALEALNVDDWGAQLLYDRALLADCDGRFDDADALLHEAHRLDPEQNPAPLRLTVDEFKDVVSDAAEALPEEFQSVFEKVPVVIDAMPTAHIVDAPHSGHPPDLLGLYVGLPLSEHESGPGGEMPPSIFLFQRNLERIGTDVDHLREEIRITLYHELAHALGFEEDGVDEMGLG